MNICVYGASSDDIHPDYIAAGEQLGALMAARGHGLVFGGGAHGMMGALARGLHSGSGVILGVAPSFFNVDGVLYRHCTEFIYTDTMRQRKQIMEERSDAFVMTAGGIGTFEEFFEILTLKQLGRHGKPIAILNTRGYYSDLQQMLTRAMDEGFLKQECSALYRICDTPAQVLDYLENYSDATPDPHKMENI